MCADRPHFWTAFLGILGLEALEHDPRFATNADRLVNVLVLERLIESRMTTDTTAAWRAKLEAAGIPCGPVLRYDAACEDPHTRERGMVVELEHAAAGKTQPIGIRALEETAVRPSEGSSRGQSRHRSPGIHPRSHAG